MSADIREEAFLAAAWKRADELRAGPGIAEQRTAAEWVCAINAAALHAKAVIEGRAPGKSPEALLVDIAALTLNWSFEV